MGYIIPIIIAGILIAIVSFLRDTFGKAEGELIFLSVIFVGVPLCAFLFLRKVIKASKEQGKQNRR